MMPGKAEIETSNRTEKGSTGHSQKHSTEKMRKLLNKWLK